MKPDTQLQQGDLIHSVINQLVDHYGVGQVIAAVLDNVDIAKRLRDNEYYFEIRSVEPGGSEWIQKCVLVARDYQLIGHNARNRPIG